MAENHRPPDVRPLIQVGALVSGVAVLVVALVCWLQGADVPGVVLWVGTTMTALGATGYVNPYKK